MFQRIRNVLEKPRVKDFIGPAWTITFAIVALLDFWVCFPKWVDGWTEGRKQTHEHGPLHQLLHGKQHQQQVEQPNGTEYCPATAVEEEDDELFFSCFRRRNWMLSLWLLRLQWTHVVGVLFCLMCIVESIRRAREARQRALDMAALDEFEKTLARLYSATKLTVFRQPSHVSVDEDQDMAATRRLIRVWTPVISHLLGWVVLLPWPLLLSALLPKLWHHSSALLLLGKDYPSHFGCGDDPALATVWITQSTAVVYETLVQWHEDLTTWLWKVALPMGLWLKPILLYQRLRLLSRWIRYFRYGGPLLRLLVKLQDQFRVFGKTWKQTWTAQTEKAKRLASRSMLFQDIQRLESLTRLQTRLAALPSQFNFGALGGGNSTSALFKRKDAFLATTTSTSSTVSLLIDSLDSSRSESPQSSPSEGFPSSVAAISTTPLSITSTSSSLTPTPTHSNTAAQRPSVAELIAKKQLESRRLARRIDHLRRGIRQSSRAFPSSELYDRVVELTQEVTRTVHSAVWNQNLISPHTRFSVAWRLCVTLALVSELGRLLLSWQLSGTFDLRYRDLTKRLLGLCQTTSRPVRKFVGKLVRLPPNHPWLDTCRQSSPSSQFSLTMAHAGEVAIDLIGFLDILVWFYTGELNENGVVVPKPFFARCILPGTLIQILDHPTVPQTIPNLISYFTKAARAVGYSRVIRWGLALYPALDLLLLSPLHRYLFHPMDKEEYLNYTESLVHFPRRRSFSSSMSLRKSPSNRGGIWGNCSSSSLNALDDDDDFVDDFGGPGDFMRPQRHVKSNSYSNVLHASISENDGYGLYY